MDERTLGAAGAASPVAAWSVERRRLLATIGRSPDSVVMVCAPTGFGKTVLVKHAVQRGDYSRTVWLDLPPDVSSERLLFERLAHALGRASKRQLTQSEPWSLHPLSSLDEAISALESMQDLAGSKTAFVIDNAPIERCPEATRDLVAGFLRVAGDASRVFLISRTGSDSLDLGASALLLDANDLRLELSEAEELLEQLWPCRRADSAAEVLSLTAGHIASFLVIGRHMALTGSPPAAAKGPGPHLGARLRAVAGSHLEAQARRALFVCALLGHGTDNDLAVVSGEASSIEDVAQSIPLVAVESGSAGGLSFRAHDIVSASFMSASWARAHVVDADDVVSRGLILLRRRGDYARVMRIIIEFLPHGLVAQLEEFGDQLLERGLADVVLRAVDRVPVDELVKRPRLLVLESKARCAVHDFAEAERKASVALTLARHAEDHETEVEALTVIEATCYSRGDLVASRDCLESILRADRRHVHGSTLLLVESRLALIYAQQGQIGDAQRHRDGAESHANSSGAVDHSMALASFRDAGIHFLTGETSRAVQTLSNLLQRPELPASIRFEGMSNLAAMLIQMGRLGRAADIVAEALRLADLYPLGFMAPVIRGTRSGLLTATGEFADALADSDAALSDLLQHGDLLNANHERLYRSQLLAASGDPESALAAAEEALEYFSANQVTVFTWHAVLELGCGLLALGDEKSARAQIEGIRKPIAAAGYRHHLLKADLLLAEADRLRGATGVAVARLAEHSGYILGGDANWTIAMTTRVFPGLLGMMGEAVVPGSLPLHMLRMVGADKLDEGLDVARPWMDAGRFEKLAKRSARFRPAGSASPVPVASSPGCHVRVFGGLEVTTPHGAVAERDWKKRKARLLFAMLIVRRGRDVPRDQLFEYLWPEMEEERARNNFYVVYNAMKHALTAGVGKGRPCPYVDNTAGVCSIVTAEVRTDLDDFDDALAEARAAESRGDSRNSVEAFARLAEIYRGDLLPGDLYDDWFAPLREHYRQEFSDAMVRGGALLEAEGDIKGALHLVRRALAHDAWREDLYQAAMRYQIEVGQRSAAVDTFMACKGKLAEDLGLDPSAATRRLYDQILAMEDDGDWDR